MKPTSHTSVRACEQSLYARMVAFLKRWLRAGAVERLLERRKLLPPQSLHSRLTARFIPAVHGLETREGPQLLVGAAFAVCGVSLIASTTQELAGLIRLPAPTPIDDEQSGQA